MKKVISLIVAAVMLFAFATSAMAITGFPASSDAKTYKNFKVEIKAYEGRESEDGLSLGTFLNGGAAKEITGRVVIGTCVIVVVKVTVPKQANTDLLARDYVNAKLNVTFGNLDVTGTPSVNNYFSGSDFLAYIPGNPPTALGTGAASTPYYKSNTTDEDYDIMLPNVSADNGNSYTFVVCGQAKKTATCPVTATFTMGQDCSVNPFFVEFTRNNNTFKAGFTSNLAYGTFDGVHTYFKVEFDGDYLCFDVNSSNKLSNMRLYSDGDGAFKTYSLGICGEKGELLFLSGTGDRYHGCDDSNAAAYANIKNSYNKLMGALGFDYNLGNADFGWATTKDVNGLANQVKVAAGYTFNECTETVPVVPSTPVKIPQTGSFAYGLAVIALALIAGAAAALRKVRA